MILSSLSSENSAEEDTRWTEFSGTAQDRSSEVSGSKDGFLDAQYEMAKQFYIHGVAQVCKNCQKLTKSRECVC